MIPSVSEKYVDYESRWLLSHSILNFFYECTYNKKYYNTVSRPGQYKFQNSISK